MVVFGREDVVVVVEYFVIFVVLLVFYALWCVTPGRVAEAIGSRSGVLEVVYVFVVCFA